MDFAFPTYYCHTRFSVYSNQGRVGDGSQVKRLVGFSSIAFMFVPTLIILAVIIIIIIILFSQFGPSSLLCGTDHLVES